PHRGRRRPPALPEDDQGRGQYRDRDRKGEHLHRVDQRRLVRDERRLSADRGLAPRPSVRGCENGTSRSPTPRVMAYPAATMIRERRSSLPLGYESRRWTIRPGQMFESSMPSVKTTSLRLSVSAEHSQPK